MTKNLIWNDVLQRETVNLMIAKIAIGNCSWWFVFDNNKVKVKDSITLITLFLSCDGMEQNDWLYLINFLECVNCFFCCCLSSSPENPWRERHKWLDSIPSIQIDLFKYFSNDQVPNLNSSRIQPGEPKCDFWIHHKIKSFLSCHEREKMAYCFAKNKKIILTLLSGWSNWR